MISEELKHEHTYLDNCLAVLTIVLNKSQQVQNRQSHATTE